MQLQSNISASLWVDCKRMLPAPIKSAYLLTNFYSNQTFLGTILHNIAMLIMQFNVPYNKSQNY